MSAATNGATTKLAEEEVSDPYELARKSAEADQTREQERERFYRRQNTFQYVVMALLAASLLVVVCLKNFTEVKVVRDHNGILSDLGDASPIAHPTDDNVAAALGSYVTCIRMVSNDDVRIDGCKLLVSDVMTQNLAPRHARDEVLAWYEHNNPKLLARDETRSVLNDFDYPIRVKNIGGNTYFIDWYEKLHSFQHGDTLSHRSGQIEIAPPFIPTDDTMRRLDTPGVIVISSDGVLL